MMAAQDDKKRTQLNLREEVEAPFRKVRLFFLWSFVGSGLVGLLIAVLRTLALSQGIDQGQSFEELAQNIGIDLVAIVGSGFLIKRDLEARDSRIARMEGGARLAALRVRLQMEDDVATVQLAALRRDRGREKRIAIVAGGNSTVATSLERALPYSESLLVADILVVPLVLEAGAGGSAARAKGGESDLPSAAGQPHVALPVNLNQWQEYIDAELLTAAGQGIDVLTDGITLVLKKNGKIGQRTKGYPPWGQLVGDVEKRKAAGMDVKNI